MLVRPSLVLQVKLMPQDYSEATAEEIKRSFIYLAQSIVSQLDAEEQSDGNIMRLSIRLMRPYWNVDDPKACELWDGVMPKWLRNTVRNISTAMHNYNTVLHPLGCSNITYDWLDLEFDKHALFRVKVDAENRISPELVRMIEQARTLLCDNAFGDAAISLIRIPSKASYEKQLEQAKLERENTGGDSGAPVAMAVAADADAAMAAAPVAAGAAGADAATAADETGLSEAAAAAAPSTSDTPGTPEASADAPGEDGASADAPADACSQSSAACSIDYRIWGIEFEDGTVLEFDSKSA